MAVVQSTDESVTTLVVDLGLPSLITIYVGESVGRVKADLNSGGWVYGDSSIGEVHVNASVIKYMQSGKREVNLSVTNRPSNLPL
jgi:hypothetical protein